MALDRYRGRLLSSVLWTHWTADVILWQARFSACPIASHAFFSSSGHSLYGVSAAREGQWIAADSMMAAEISFMSLRRSFSEIFMWRWLVVRRQRTRHGSEPAGVDLLGLRCTAGPLRLSRPTLILPPLSEPVGDSEGFAGGVTLEVADGLMG
jgi:hypothetical protein